MTGLQKIRIGTRASKLALIQAHTVQERLQAAHPGLEAEIVEITTSGDWKPSDGETRLSEAEGGKGLFAKEIETALLDGHVDIGVHSLKDMPSFLPDGLVIDHVLEREDPRDVFISANYKSLEELPQGAKLGTSSLRRQAMALALRPDLEIVPLRGNVGTRLEKIQGGQADATFLAAAGLKRLGLEEHIKAYMGIDQMLPAAAQGVIGIECRAGEDDIQEALKAIHHEPTGFCATAERAALQILDGSCHTPIGAYAVLEGKQVTLKALVASEDGAEVYKDSISGAVKNTQDAQALGETLGRQLKDVIPPDLLT